ncbi:protein DEHYDRATION-INDUCED 19 homolog 2-like [Phalaenopsis equestris]|uniref:protein DEHYDRATION-INDUCED 19 homolog 2-like n=1 Tax=Phalaenopsis equestris TaxID=78828 RepID=UPI0009E5179B|nr:protein DEHYDRATION-INDUCED 19 homolog 2-like [Phalaenopsis equestris]
MEADPWSRLFSASSKRHQLCPQSRYDLHLGAEEVDGIEDDSCAEFFCPFCSEYFDIGVLCSHIDDEHPQEANSGICPICGSRAGVDLVGHLTMEHGNFFKIHKSRRFRRGALGSHSTLSLLRKELRETNAQALLGGWSHSSAPLSAAPDPLLSSLIYTLPVANSSNDMPPEPESLDEGAFTSEHSEKKAVESSIQCLSDKEQEERIRKCDFVQGLVLSTIFEDID